MEALGAIVVAFLFSVGIGDFLAQKTILSLRKRVQLPALSDREKLLVRLVGCSERAIATALTIWEPEAVHWFIGGWVLLKFAGGWKRYTKPTPRNRAIYQIAMLGNAVSFAVAVIVGVLYRVWFPAC